MSREMLEKMLGNVALNFFDAAIDSEASTKIGDVAFVPVHPGIVIRDNLMPNMNIDRDFVSNKSRISPDDLNALLTGNLDVSRVVSKKLSHVFGAKAAHVLVNMQKLYDHYSATGELPRAAARSEWALTA